MKGEEAAEARERFRRRGWLATGVTVAVAGAVAVALHARERGVACGGGFVRAGSRCCDTSESHGGVCARSTAPRQRMVRIPATRLVLGSSDWEAEGRVPPRTIDVRPFDLDVYEETVGAGDDAARARSGLSASDAAALCASQKKRLPTEDEWIAAASGPSAKRYPWGDTGAVCRRAAWGLAAGPCADDGSGPDSVGAHPDGRTPLGIEDMAGNVAEWVTTAKGPVAYGGSWRSVLATELRTWSRLELDPALHDDRLGVRCARDTPEEPVDSSTP